MNAELSQVQDLEELMSVLRSLDVEDDTVDWTALPTFGGTEPHDTSGVWSWDATHLLVGESSDELRIEPRSYYHCQIEGDESAVIEERSEEQAARRYVQDSDWSPEPDGWSGTGTLTVWVTPCNRDGTHDPNDRQYIRVEVAA